MANIYVNSAAAGSNNGTSWTNAYTALASAVSGASANDKIYVANTHSESNGASVTYTPAAAVELWSTSDTTNMPPTTYASGAQIAVTAAFSITVSSGYWNGFVFRAGTSNNTTNIFLGSANSVPTLEDCDIGFGLASGGTGKIRMGNNALSKIRTVNCSFTWTSTFSQVDVRCPWYDEGSNLDAGSVHPTTLVICGAAGLAYMEFNGSSFAANANTYFSGSPTAPFFAKLTNCITNASATIVGTQSADAVGEVWMYDCDSGDNHYKFAHYNYRGNTVMSTARYVTSDGASYDGSNKYCMQVTGSNVSFSAPYHAPWIDVYTAGGSSVTPYLEIVRDGSSTAYKDNEVWGEFMAKTTSGSTKSTRYSDRVAALGTAANQAAGTGTSNWTGLSGTKWSGKVDSGSAFTPQEIGMVRARVVMAVADTVYVDPKVRGL